MKSACVFCIDDAYVMPFQVFFHSLEATDSIPTSASLFILHTTALSSTSIVLLETFLGSYGRVVSFVDATTLIPADLPIRPGDHVSPATFYRLFIAEILPKDIDQAIYLDSDMLALRSIASLFEEPVQGLVAAVDELSPGDEIRLWGACGGAYFQAGVMVIPLQSWREHGLMQQFDKVMVSERHRIRFWDQDVLNIALRDRWQRLPIWFNVGGSVIRFLPWDQIQEHSILIHYNGTCKPWNSFNPSPFTAQWDQAYQAVYGHPFARNDLIPSFRFRMKSAVRSRIKGLIYGGQ